jgi:hypothetical protein
MVLATCMHVMQEDGWVVCRVFKKKSIQRGFDDHLGMAAAGDDDELHSFHSPGGVMTPVDQKHGLHQLMHGGVPAFDPSMHLPHLTSAEAPLGAPAFTSGGTSAVAMNLLDMGCSSHNMVMKMTTSCGSASDMPLNSGGERFGAAADWSILDKLLASHQNLDQLFHCKFGGTTLAVPRHYQQQQMQQQQQQLMEMSASSLHRLPLH